MLAAVYLLVTCLAGFALATRAVPTAPAIVRLPAGFLLAVVFTSWSTYLVAAGLAGQTDHSLKIGLAVSTLLGAAIVFRYGRSLRLSDLRMPAIDAAFVAVAVAISAWLMRAHLRIQDGELAVSANAWGDAALHVAISRSFSAGANYPTQYPFFADEPIRYHFGFDFFAGMLQEGGFSVLWSFDLAGIIGFTALLTITFAICRLLFSAAPAASSTPGAAPAEAATGTQAAPTEPAAGATTEPATGATTEPAAGASTEPATDAPQPQTHPRWFRDQGVWIGFVAAALLLTNQSLGWLRYLEADGGGNVWQALKPSVLWKHEGYLATGPYADDRIAIFNTLNPYVGQMHLIVAIALVLLLTYVVLWQLRAGDQLDRRLLVGVGVTFGAALWLNGVVWLAGAIFLGMLLVIWGGAATWRARREAPADRRGLAARAAAITWLKILACFAVPALVLGLPQALLLSGGEGIKLHLGYLVCSTDQSSCYGEQMNPLSPADWWSFVEFWWLNQGVAIPLLILAFFLGTWRDKKIIAATTAVFLWGSMVQVGLDLGGHNHKVFNLWEVLVGPFVAFALIALWLTAGRLAQAGFRGTAAFTRLAVVGLAWLLMVTGAIDAMTLKNDTFHSVFGDEVQQSVIEWIAEETPPRASFLTDYEQLYTSPTMAGRRIFLGYSPWVSGAGYDVEPRKQIAKQIFEAPDRPTVCRLLTEHRIDYVMISGQERGSERFVLNAELFAQMTPAKTAGEGDNAYAVYRVADNC